MHFAPFTLDSILGQLVQYAKWHHLRLWLFLISPKSLLIFSLDCDFSSAYNELNFFVLSRKWTSLGSRERQGGHGFASGWPSTSCSKSKSCQRRASTSAHARTYAILRSLFLLFLIHFLNNIFLFCPIKVSFKKGFSILNLIMFDA